MLKIDFFKCTKQILIKERWSSYFIKKQTTKQSITRNREVWGKEESV